MVDQSVAERTGPVRRKGMKDASQRLEKVENIDSPATQDAPQSCTTQDLFY